MVIEKWSVSENFVLGPFFISKLSQIVLFKFFQHFYSRERACEGFSNKAGQGGRTSFAVKKIPENFGFISFFLKKDPEIGNFPYRPLLSYMYNLSTVANGNANLSWLQVVAL